MLICPIYVLFQCVQSTPLYVADPSLRHPNLARTSRKHRAAEHHAWPGTGQRFQGAHFRDGLGQRGQIRGWSDYEECCDSRKFHCHLRNISSMATMNDLRSNDGPWTGKYMIQVKRITRLDICSKQAARYISSGIQRQRKRTIAQ